MKVLLIEDNPEIINGISLTFKLRWPDAVVFSSEDGSSGIDSVKKNSPDIVILDINLPDMDGFSVLNSIRRFSNVPVIILTVRGDEVDELRGLEIGADDYITKPFSPANLLVRGQAVLRRAMSGSVQKDSEIKIGDLSICPEKMEVNISGERVHLTRNESKILFCLAENPDKIVLMENLKEKVWGKEANAIDNNALKRYIFQLRNKLGDTGTDPSIIINEHGIGYRLMSERPSAEVN